MNAFLLMLAGLTPGAAPPPANDNPVRLIELTSPKPEWAPNELPVILCTWHNVGIHTCSIALPHHWTGSGADWFIVHRNGKELFNQYRLTSFGNRDAILRPGERVTVAFEASGICMFPERPADRPGRYVVKMDRIEDWGWPRRQLLKAKPLVFHVRLPAKDEGLVVKQIRTNEDAASAKALMRLRSLTPHDRLQLVLAASRAGRRELVWELIELCDDSYALVESMDRLPPKMFDARGALRLLLSKDLAVRRASVQALGRSGKDEATAAKLAKFLESQKDEVLLRYGKEALRRLRGEPEAGAKRDLD